MWLHIREMEAERQERKHHPPEEEEEEDVIGDGAEGEEEEDQGKEGRVERKEATAHVLVQRSSTLRFVGNEGHSNKC